MNRWALFWGALAVGIALTVLLWSFGIWAFFLPLLFPAVFWPRGARKVCPRCGHETMHPAERYCPVDGERLEAI